MREHQLSSPLGAIWLVGQKLHQATRDYLAPDQARGTGEWHSFRQGAGRGSRGAKAIFLCLYDRSAGRAGVINICAPLGWAPARSHETEGGRALFLLSPFEPDRERARARPRNFRAYRVRAAGRPARLDNPNKWPPPLINIYCLGVELNSRGRPSGSWRGQSGGSAGQKMDKNTNKQI